MPQPTPDPAPIPPDDPNRKLTVANPDADQSLPHLGVVGDTYTILLSGQDTAGKLCLIDMYVPPGGGPPPHRHDFEETFILQEGELTFTFRGQTSIAKAGTTLHIPANAPHQFHNSSDQPARLLCICSPSGQEDLFRQVGTPVTTRTAPPPPLDDKAQAALRARSEALAPQFRTELLPEA